MGAASSCWTGVPLVSRMLIPWRERRRSSHELETGLMARQLTTSSSADPHRRVSRLLSSFVAGAVSFMLSTIMSVNFGILVFKPVAGAIPRAVKMSIVGVGIIGNLAQTLNHRLPNVVITADNGVVAPVVAEMVVELANVIDDVEVLRATCIAAVALACACFGLAQLVMVKLKLTQLVKFLPYSIPMGFLSGIGLELLTGIGLAGSYPSQGVAALFAAVLCYGSWWKGWPLSVLFPVLLGSSLGAFYLAGAPKSWLLELEGDPSTSSTPCFWCPETFVSVQWYILLSKGAKWFGTLFLLGSFQNILFAEVFARTPGLTSQIQPDHVMQEFGQSFFLGGIFGFTGGFHNMACFSLNRELKAYAKAPSLIVTIMSSVLWTIGIEPLLLVPRFIFAGMLLWVGLKFIRTYLITPARMLPRAETANIIIVAGIMKINGFATGVLAGLLLALIGIIGELAQLGCVQVESSGLEARSNAIRSVRAEQLLLTLGQKVLVLRMAPGFVFFATSAQLLKIVERRLEAPVPPWQTHDPWIAFGSSDSSDDEALGSPAITLSNVVIDFTLCRGFDGSLLGVLQQLAAVGSRSKFQLSLAGLQPSQKRWIKEHVPSGTVSFFADLDRALEFVEDKLLESSGLSRAKETRRPSVVTMANPKRISCDMSFETKMQAVNIQSVTDADSFSTGWALLFLYSDNSAISRSTRPAVSQAMALVERYCDLFEASEESCPELAKRFGRGPHLILFRFGEPSLVIDGERMNAGSRKGASGVAMLPVAVEIAREIEQHIYKSEERNLRTEMAASLPTATAGLDSLFVELSNGDRERSRADSAGSDGGSPFLTSPVLSPKDSFGERTPSSDLQRATSDLQRTISAEKVIVRRKPKAATIGDGLQRRRSLGVDRNSSDSSYLWPQFLQLAGVPNQSSLEKLRDVVVGPRQLQKGEILLHKGSAQTSLYFVVNGNLSLWNEGRGHDQHNIPDVSAEDINIFDSKDPQRQCSTLESIKLSQGSSRLLRIGPGWTIGGNLGQASGLKQQTALVTCTAETQARVLELPTQKLKSICENEPEVAFALQELIMHFHGQLFQHTAALLSDMHALVFAQPN